ncbi:hypothetical protein X777_10123 [Ooceraea biroi]|nr:hypothetical protein X777_10123 [Ooceraea biroi]
MFSETGYFMQNEQSYMMSHHFSPQPEDAQSNGGRDSGGAYSRYMYPHQQHYAAERAVPNSTSPRSSLFQCDKCGAVYEDANQLGEHVRTNHLDSPSTYSAPQYQQLGNSPQQQGQQLHPSPPLSNQAQQPPGYDYNGGQTVKEMKQEPEEQAEILDLDSHKVQTHKYEEELMRLQQQQQQQQQGLQMQMHHQQVMQQQQRIGSHSVSSMLGWPPATQTHDYHVGLPPMGTVDNVPPMTDQSQFMRGQHMPVEHGHQGSSIITSTQSMTSHQMPSGFVQQSPKAQPLANQSWKSNEPRRPKTYNCTACNKWFTSSGHLKRHYNTTLHKNAVKNGKDPDPANLPISAHHHPARDNNGGPSASGRGSGATTRSPSDLSSRSPPNLMAGPSGEVTGGLLHTPTTLCNSNSNSSSSNSDSSAVALVQQQQQQQLAVHLPHSGIMPLNSPGPSPLTGHHQQQMSSAPHQLALQQQQQQQQLHLSTGSSGQPVHHTTSHSPMPPPPTSHMNCPSPMRSSSHPHHMNTPGSVTPVTSPTGMGGTTMPHQPYPNALPPHVTTTTSIPAVLLESIPPVTTIQLTTIGNKEDEQQHQPQQQHQMNMLPGFGTIEQRILPSFTQFGVTGFVVEQNQIQTVNVGGLNVEEITPQETSYESSQSYEPYSPAHYKSINVGTMQSTDNITSTEDVSHSAESLTYQLEHLDLEANNNNLAKEDMDPNVTKPKKGRKTKAASSKKCQFTTTGANFISKEGFHKCIDCNKEFNKACYLTQHNKSFHSGDKPFKCAQCGKRFHNEELHAKHVLMHGMTRKHQCDACPKVFAHRTDLKRHQCIHTGQRPFKCDMCEKGFIRQDHMKKHRHTHSKKSRIQNQRINAQRYGYVAVTRVARC